VEKGRTEHSYQQSICGNRGPIAAPRLARAPHISGRRIKTRKFGYAFEPAREKCGPGPTHLEAMMFPYAWPAFLSTIASILSDGKTHAYVGLLEQVARTYALTPEERKLTMANRTNVFLSRVDFALARLVTKKGVVKLVPKDGLVAYQITEHGLDVVRRKGREVKIHDF
jgi:hypothetical protein